MDYQNNVSEERVAEMIWDAVSEGATLKRRSWDPSRYDGRFICSCL